MAAYDTYGRPLRGNGEPSYFDHPDPEPEFTGYYPSEPRDSSPSLRHGDPTKPRNRTSPPIYDRMAAAPERDERSGSSDVSPEVIAAITEKVKKELLEHLKQTGGIDEPARAPSTQRDHSSKSSSTSSPPPTARRVYTPPSPIQPQRPKDQPPMEYKRSPPLSPTEKQAGEKPGVRFGRGIPTRPAAGRTFSTMELSTIDQKWGRLFDKEGNPTQRLGQFLRGLANHMIENYLPKNSIVVTPAKMAMFYASYPLDKEPHPLLTIFRAQSNEHISSLYQDLGCEHHLTQVDVRSPPVVPSLTAVGFAHWMTINILAFPEEEYKRFEKVVCAMPIDADGDLVDGKPERLPKQISRHLLPDREDKKSRKLLDDAIASFFDDLGSTNRRKASLTNQPGVSRHSSISQTRPRPVEIHQEQRASTAASNPIERERKPYSGAPVSDISSNEDSVKIERERQPYSAQPGSGKLHDDNLNIPSRVGRSNSISGKRDQPEDARRNRGNSNANQTTSGHRSRRPSSPPSKNWSHSTPDDINISKYGPNNASSSSNFTNPGSYGSNPTFPPPPGPPPIDIHRRSRDDRQYRRDASNEPRFAEFNSPRDAEKWDRYQEERDEPETSRYDRPYERPAVPADPRDSRGGVGEEWYREKSKLDYEPRRY